MVFVAVPWCGLGMVRFRLAVVGFLWGWLVLIVGFIQAFLLFVYSERERERETV